MQKVACLVIQPQLAALVYKLVEDADKVVHVTPPAQEQDALHPFLGPPLRAAHLDAAFLPFHWRIGVIILSQHNDLVPCKQSADPWLCLLLKEGSIGRLRKSMAQGKELWLGFS